MPRWKREEYMDASGAWRMPDDDYIDYSGCWRTVDDFYVICFFARLFAILASIKEIYGYKKIRVSEK